MSVERTIVRLPRFADSSAVAAAMLVLPTPPLPVYRRILVTGVPQLGHRWGDADPNTSPGRARGPMAHHPGMLDAIRDVSSVSLLDAGDGRRLERFGARVLDRPHPGAGEGRRAPGRWRTADLRFDRPSGWTGRADSTE